MSNRACKKPAADAGSKICFPGALQNYHSETSDFLSFFSSEIFLGRFSTEIDDLGLILDDQAQPPKMILRKRQILSLIHI